MADLIQELRAYAGALEDRADPVTWAEVSGGAGVASRTARTRPAVTGWVVAVAAAAAVLVLVGLITVGTLFGDSDVATSDLIEPTSAGSNVTTPYGDATWWLITGDAESVPGARVYAKGDGSWVSADQMGRSWESATGIRWRLVEENGSAVASEDRLANDVWIRRMFPGDGGGPLSVSWDGGTTFLPVVPPTAHPDGDLTWTDYAVSVAPYLDGVMVVWTANGAIPWNRIIGIDDQILHIQSMGTDGTLEIATGRGEDPTARTRVRIEADGDNVVIYGTKGEELWRHRLPAANVPSLGGELDLEEESLAFQTYGVTWAMQIITPGTIEEVPLPPDVQSIFAAYETDSAAESLLLMAGSELRLVGVAPPLREEEDPWHVAVWRWTNAGWSPDGEPRWLDETVTGVSNVRIGSDSLVSVWKDVGNDVVTEWWLDFDRAQLNVPPEVAHGLVFDVSNGFVGVSSDFDRPRFWYSPDGGEWAGFTPPDAGPFPDSPAGGMRSVWAENDRVFAADTPFEGPRSFWVADISGLSGS